MAELILYKNYFERRPTNMSEIDFLEKKIKDHLKIKVISYKSLLIEPEEVYYRPCKEPKWYRKTYYQWEHKVVCNIFHEYGDIHVESHSPFVTFELLEEILNKCPDSFGEKTRIVFNQKEAYNITLNNRPSYYDE